jgi:hypothetical protein
MRDFKSFRGYASDSALLHGLSDTKCRYIRPAPNIAVPNLVEVVPLPPLAPDAPPVGAEISITLPHPKTALTGRVVGPVVLLDGVWRIPAARLMHGSWRPVFPRLSNVEWGDSERSYKVTLKGSEKDAEHLRKLLAGHGLTVNVEEVSSA